MCTITQIAFASHVYFESLNYTEEPLQGRVQSESVTRTDVFQPRTPELACSIVSDSHYYRELPSERPSRRVGSDGNI
eukprot:6212975-Pleurochrysis_carterae.AAC.1